MMRGQRYMAVAVRAPSHEIVLRSESLPPRLYQSRLMQLPLLRGMVLLWDALGLGIRALMFSADVSMGQEDVQLARPVAWSTVALGIILGIALFFVLPVVLTALLHAQLGSPLLANVAEGLVRVSLLVGYVGLIGLFPDIRRVYMYHGAEHKAINALEAGGTLTVAEVGRFGIRHPRCGTNFLLIVAMLTIAAFAPLGRPDSWFILVGSRILMIPLIAAVAYEAIKWGAAHIRNPLVAALMLPGLALQALTTREPDETQIEVAIAALREVLRLEAEPAPAAA